MNQTNRTTLKQMFIAIGKAMIVNGERFSFNQVVYDDTNNELIVSYQSNVPRGIFADSFDQLVVTVAYDDGADLYNVKVRKFDAEEYTDALVFECDGFYNDQFADLPNFLTHAMKVA